MNHKIIFILTTVLITGWFTDYISLASAAIPLAAVSSHPAITPMTLLRKQATGKLNILLTASQPSDVNQRNLLVHIVDSLTGKERLINIPWQNQVIVDELIIDNQYVMYAETINGHIFIFFPSVILVQEKPAFIVIQMVT